MGGSPNVKKFIVTIVLVLIACARHDDILPRLDVAEPPIPRNFLVETTDQITYHLSWEIDDPSIVKEYRVYSKFAGSSPVLEGTTDTTVVEVNTQIPIPGVSFCVSAVTVENVESSLTCASAE